MDTVLICVIIVLVVLLFACNSDLCDRTNKLVEGAKGFFGLSKFGKTKRGNFIKNSLKTGAGAAAAGISNYPPSLLTMNQRDDTSRFGEGLAGHHVAGYGKERLAPSSATQAVGSLEKAARGDLYAVESFDPDNKTPSIGSASTTEDNDAGLDYREILARRMVGNDADFEVMNQKQKDWAKDGRAIINHGNYISDAMPNADMRRNADLYTMIHGFKDYPDVTHNSGDRVADNGPPIKPSY